MINKKLLGYKIFDDLVAFYKWQGRDNAPEPGTVNFMMGFSKRSELGSIRFSIAIPNSGASDVTYNKWGMPVAIRGGDVRVATPVVDLCPTSKIPAELLSRAECVAEGWDLEPED